MKLSNWPNAQEPAELIPSRLSGSSFASRAQLQLRMKMERKYPLAVPVTQPAVEILENNFSRQFQSDPCRFGVSRQFNKLVFNRVQFRLCMISLLPPQ